MQAAFVRVLVFMGGSNGAERLPTFGNIGHGCGTKGWKEKEWP